MKVFAEDFNGETAALWKQLSETTGIFANSVREEKEDRIVNYQKQGPGRRTVFWLQMSVLEWQSAYIQRRPERVVLMKVFWGWQYSYSQHFVKVKDFLKCVATSRIQSSWTISNFQKFYKAILQQNNQVTWKIKNSIWKLQQIIDFALQNKFTNFCSSCILLLVLQAELSVTSSEFRVKEKNCALVTTTKKTWKRGHAMGDICHEFKEEEQTFFW